MAVSVAAIPLSMWCFQFANGGGVGDLASRLLGPQVRAADANSAPDYMAWDIATMSTMLVACAAATFYLGLQIVRRVRSSGRT